MTSSPARLINAEAMRTQVRRLFSGSWHEIYSELLQNAQRADATTFTITTQQENPDEAIITICDNGKGIKDIDGFESLLCIGESGWEPSVILNQQPMGLGIQALIASPSVTMISLESHAVQILFDTSRWWRDIQYAETWKDRVRTSTVSEGLKITIIGKPQIINETLNAFEVNQEQPPTYEFTNNGVARGYEGILAVTLNGLIAPTDLPPLSALRKPLIRTHFEGCPLIIGVSDQFRSSIQNAINWYGQIVKFGQPQFPFYLDVKAGRPVDLKAPVRSGPIQNEKLEALEQAVRDELRTYFLTTNTDASDALLWLKTLTTKERADVPFTVGSKWKPPTAGEESNTFDSLAELEILPLNNLPTFIHSDIEVILNEDGESLTIDTGYTSFTGLLENPYHANFNDAHYPLQTVWWKPGNLIEARGESWTEEGGTRFYESGQWGHGTADTPPTKWQDVPADTPLVLVNESSCWSVNDANIFTNIERLPFYEDNWAMAGFSPYHDEETFERLLSSYEESIEENIRDLIGDCVASNFSYEDLQFFAPAGETLSNIAITKEAKARTLLLTFSDGTTKELKTR